MRSVPCHVHVQGLSAKMSPDLGQGVGSLVSRAGVYVGVVCRD